MFKIPIRNLLFAIAAALGAQEMPVVGSGGPRQRGTPLSFDSNGNGKDAYGRSYIRKAGVIIRNDCRVSKLSRRVRKAIWSGK